MTRAARLGALLDRVTARARALPCHTHGPERGRPVDRTRAAHLAGRCRTLTHALCHEASARFGRTLAGERTD